jgi:tetratricopeptide (TPR) repeat protein
MVPPHLGSWTAQGIAAYFSPGYELVDRARLYWYMGRLGITTRDLLYDPAARYYLGRALNIRFFLFGTIRETASFDVATYMVHAEHGYLTNGARIHCRNIAELKIRLPELAWRTSLDQAERIRLQRDEASWTLLVNDIRQRHNRNDYAATIRLCQDALRRRPGNVEIAIIQRDCEDQLQRLAMLEARNNSYRQQQQLFIQIQDRRGEVARAAELARIQAEQHALALPMNERLAVQRNRETAYQNLVTQAQIAIQGKRFGVALQLFHSAAAIRPNDAIYREIAVVKAQADQAERERDLAVRALHEANLRKQREAELAQARTLLEAERQRRDADELARRKAQDARDQQEYARLLDLAQRLSAKGQFDQAVGAAQRAKQIRPTNEAERLVNQLLVEQAKAAAERQGAAARAKLEADLAAERQRRADAEAELAKARQQFDLLLREANAALAAEQFERALERYGAAAKLHRTDAVLSGIRSAETGIARRKAIAEAEKTRLAQQEQKAAKLKSVLADANAAMIAKDYGRAVSLFREAKRLAPTNVDALAGLTQAEQKLERVAAEVRRKDEDKSRKESFQKLLASGKASLAANRFEAAAIALAEAVRLMPDNAEAKSALDEANRQLGADAKRQTELKKKMDEYQRHIADGRRAMSTKQFDQAIKAFNSAILLLPDDKASKDYLAEAVAAKNKADADIVIEAQKRQEAARRNVALNSALAKVRGALAARDVAAATAAYRDAAKIDANHEEVKQALLDVRRLQDHMQAAADNEKRLGQKIDDLITKARSALAAKRFDEAIEALSEANRLRPNQKVIADLMAQATKGRADTTKTTPVADDRQKKVAALIVEAKTAIAAKQWDAAEKFLNDANRLIPRSADVQKLLVEIDTGRKQMMVDDQLRKRQAAFQVAIKAAQEALTAKRLDDAANAVADALKLQPNDAAALALQRQIQSAKDNTAAQMKIEQLKRDVAKFVDQANKALTAKQFDVAEKALADALKIAPNDRDLLTLRGRIQSAKADAQAAMKADQTRAEVAKLLGDARKALTSRQLDEADKAIDNALRLMPGNQDAMALRTQVKQARSSADAAMKSEQRKQEFNKLIAQTKASLFAKKLDEATKNVRDALQLFPNDPTAIDLVRQIDAARQAQNAAMKKEQDRKSEYDRQMKLGRAAMAGRRFEEAARAFTAALAQMPNDAAATQLLAEVKKALEVPKKPAGPPPGYKVQMDAGDGHLKAQKWADAAKAFQYATRIAPGDAEASKRMRFASSMDDGDKAMKAKRFAEAVRHFEQALRLIPDNKDAQDLLNRAKKSK